MYISKSDREKIFNKFNGLCAYSGTPLEEDWQVDHVEPLRRDLWGSGCIHPDNHNIENLVPCQKIINHYKHSLDIVTFKTWLLAGLHTRLKKLPKNPKTEKTRKRKEYILKVAHYFGINENTPFSGTFYFELHPCSSSNYQITKLTN